MSIGETTWLDGLSSPATSGLGTFSKTIGDLELLVLDPYCRFRASRFGRFNGSFVHNFVLSKIQRFHWVLYRLINNIGTKAIVRHLEKYTCKGTLRLFFFHGLETWATFSHVGIFYPALWTIAPLTFSLVQFSPPHPFPVWISILFTRIQCERGGGLWGSGPQTNTCRKVRSHVNFLDDDILLCCLHS